MALIRRVLQNQKTKKWAYIQYSDEDQRIIHILGGVEFDTEQEAIDHSKEIEKQSSEGRQLVCLTGIDVIKAERIRQQTEEKYSLDHDEVINHTGALAMAAASYATPAHQRLFLAQRGRPLHFPWKAKSWKPTPHDRIKELAKAGALIAAEIDRLTAHALAESFPNPKVESCTN